MIVKSDLSNMYMVKGSQNSVKGDGAKSPVSCKIPICVVKTGLVAKSNPKTVASLPTISAFGSSFGSICLHSILVYLGFNY